MKKVFLLVLSILFSIGTSITVLASEHWQDAYKEKILELEQNDIYPEPESPCASWDTLSLYDIDDNGIPELIYNGETIYTYENSIVVKAGTGNLSYLLPERNSFLGRFVQQDMINEWWIAEFKLENGQITPDYQNIMKDGVVQIPKENLFAYSDYRDSSEPKFYISGKQVSSDQAIHKYLDKNTISPKTHYAYSVRENIDNPLSTFITKRYEQAAPSQQNISLNSKKAS